MDVGTNKPFKIAAIHQYDMLFVDHADEKIARLKRPDGAKWIVRVCSLIKESTIEKTW
jgi:hypothetical protein